MALPKEMIFDGELVGLRSVSVFSLPVFDLLIFTFSHDGISNRHLLLCFLTNHVLQSSYASVNWMLSEYIRRQIKLLWQERIKILMVQLTGTLKLHSSFMLCRYISIAVATDKGLMTLIIRKANLKSISAISLEVL